MSTKSIAKIDTADVTLTDARLSELETTIRDGSRAFIAVGVALAEIRDGKGYKLRGYKTFELFCEKEFGISDRHGRRLIQATETAAAVKQITGSAPGSESVARELTAIAGDQKKVEKVAAILERKGYSVVTATAEAVKEAVQRVTAPRPAAQEGNGKAVVMPGANGKGKTPEPLEPLDLAFINAVLSRAELHVPAHDRLASDLRRALTMVRGELGRQAAAASGPKCKHCGKPVAQGDPFCGNCGELL